MYNVDKYGYLSIGISIKIGGICYDMILIIWIVYFYIVFFFCLIDLVKMIIVY